MTVAAPTDACVTIVSGLPRSGTSLMMQMLAAGGLAPLTDGVRAADPDNPRGYLEYEPVKKLKEDAGWVAAARGKALKAVHVHLYDLPRESASRVIFMQRRLEEVVASQRAMLARAGKTGAKLPDAQLVKIFERDVEKVLAFLAANQDRFAALRVRFDELVKEPARAAAEVNRFLGGGLDEAAMSRAVDPALHRQKR